MLCDAQLIRILAKEFKNKEFAAWYLQHKSATLATTFFSAAKPVLSVAFTASRADAHSVVFLRLQSSLTILGSRVLGLGAMSCKLSNDIKHGIQVSEHVFRLQRLERVPHDRALFCSNSL